ncbi:MAG: HEAT repeat domain-containing protein [Planctomycetota bacterium]
MLRPLRILSVALLLMSPADADPATMAELIARLAADETEARGAAREEIERRFEEWSEADFKRLQDAGSDADAERAAGARQAAERIALLRRIGPSLMGAWERIGAPEPPEDSTEADHPDDVKAPEDPRTSKLLQFAASAWKGGGASDREVRELVAMIRAAGGDPVRGLPYRELASRGCRPLAPEIAARLEARTDDIEKERAFVVEALGKAGDSKFGDLVTGYVFAPAPLQKVALEAARKLKATSAAAAIAHLTEDQDWRIRKAAVEALGGCATDRELPAMRRRLMDPVTNVRTAAARAFRELGRREALPWLEPLLRDRMPRVVAASTWAYGGLADSGSAVRLYSVGAAPFRKGAALAGWDIARLRPPGWKERMIDWLTSPSGDLSYAAAEAIELTACREAAPAALRLLKDPHPEARLAACMVLRSIDPPGLVEAAAPLASDPNLEIRQNFLYLIASTRGERWAPALDVLLRDTESGLRREALGAAMVAYAPSQLPIAEALLKDANRWVRAEAASFLGRRGGPAQKEILLALLADREMEAYAALALGDLGDKDAVPALRKAAESKDTNLRDSAARALAALGSTAELVRMALDGDEWWVRQGMRIEIPAAVSADLARRTLARFDIGWVGWDEISLLLFIDSGTLQAWDHRDRRELVRRVRNVAAFDDDLLRFAARLRLFEWGEDDEKSQASLVARAASRPWDDQFNTALALALAARHEAEWWRKASVVREIPSDLVTTSHIEAWAALGGTSLDMQGFSSKRTWRAGSRVSVLDILRETVRYSERAILVQDGKARIAVLPEVIEAWRKRLSR